jgi:hypothetical protein
MTSLIVGALRIDRLRAPRDAGGGLDQESDGGDF